MLARARTLSCALLAIAAIHCSSSPEPLETPDAPDEAIASSEEALGFDPRLFCGERWQACCTRKVDFGIPGHHRVTEKYCNSRTSLRCVNDACDVCGGVGEACCDGSTCRDGGRCFGSTCTACGGAGQLACTTGAPCRGNTEQAGAICVSCGGDGDAKCTNGQPACQPGFELDSRFERCRKPWGREGQPCDEHGSCFNPVAGSFLTCYGGTCEPNCGHLNEECCNASAFDGYCRGGGLACTLDILRGPQKKCEACGGKDQPCCPGSRCNGGLGCRLTGPFVNTCQPPSVATPGGSGGGDPSPGCGARGERCCSHQTIAGSYCDPGAYCGGTTCSPCGRRGEACCPSTTTSSMGSCSDGSTCSGTQCM